jgi:hypothetical protein
VLFAKYNYTDQEEEDKMSEACSRNGEKRNARILVKNPKGNRPLGRPRRRWIILRWERWGGMGWTGLVWLKIRISVELL